MFVTRKTALENKTDSSVHTKRLFERCPNCNLVHSGPKVQKGDLCQTCFLEQRQRILAKLTVAKQNQQEQKEISSAKVIINVLRKHLCKNSKSVFQIQRCIDELTDLEGNLKTDNTEIHTKIDVFRKSLIEEIQYFATLGDKN